jgi:L-lactate dehydrogenase complex protein LldG
MSSRESILARLKAGARPAPSVAAAYRPAAVADLAERLIDRARTVLATGEILASLDELPAAVAAYLTGQALAREAAVGPELAHLGWADAGVEMLDAPSRRSVGASVALVAAAIAETGSIVLTSREAPWANLLADTHVAVIPRERIVAGIEDVVVRLAGNRLPRSLHIASGPSRTGDIEQTLELGAHGAVRLHLVVVP